MCAWCGTGFFTSLMIQNGYLAVAMAGWQAMLHQELDDLGRMADRMTELAGSKPEVQPHSKQAIDAYSQAVIGVAIEDLLNPDKDDEEALDKMATLLTAMTEGSSSDD